MHLFFTVAFSIGGISHCSLLRRMHRVRCLDREAARQDSDMDSSPQKETQAGEIEVPKGLLLAPDGVPPSYRSFVAFTIACWLFTTDSLDST